MSPKATEAPQLAEGGAEGLESFRYDAIPDPQAALVSGDEAGVNEEANGNPMEKVLRS